MILSKDRLALVPVQFAFQLFLLKPPSFKRLVLFLTGVGRVVTAECEREEKTSGQRQDRGGDRKSKSDSTTLIPGPSSLADLGITRDQSSKWQQLAAVPSEEFERAVKGSGPKPTTEGIINAQTLRESKPAPRMDPMALWLWGRLKDFERDRVFDRDFDELAELMTDSMREDALRIAPRLAAWLKGR